MIGHDNMFASADEVISEAFRAFVVVDDDFVDVRKGVDFLLRCFIERFPTIGDSMFVNDRDSEVDIIPETVGVIGERIDVLGAVVVQLRFGMNLDKFEAEGFGGELLRFRIRAVTTTGKEVFAAN